MGLRYQAATEILKKKSVCEIGINPSILKRAQPYPVTLTSDNCESSGLNKMDDIKRVEVQRISRGTNMCI